MESPRSPLIKISRLNQVVLRYDDCASAILELNRPLISTDSLWRKNLAKISCASSCDGEGKKSKLFAATSLFVGIISRFIQQINTTFLTSSSLQH